MKKINLLLIVYFFLLSCGGLKDAGKVLRNEKIRTTDEFLVKKRNPLVLPPNFEEIPEPQFLRYWHNRSIRNPQVLPRKFPRLPFFQCQQPCTL